VKTFADLKFEKRKHGMGQQAKMQFDNGFGVSVLLGDMFYSNGVDTYEVGILDKAGDLTYSSGITEDVIGRVSSDEVTKIMKQVQKLKVKS
jgi:hypothetical protein